MIPDDYLTDLKSRLASQAEDVFKHLLRGGKRVGNRWLAGGADGSPGKSLYGELVGDSAGLWRDAATGEGGDLLTLWQANQGVTFTEAVAASAGFVGMLPPDTRETAPKLAVLSPANYVYSEPPPPEEPQEALPEYNPNATTPKQSAGTDWRKAVAAFTDDHATKLCEWRGFSKPFVDWLHKQELIGVHNGCFAFPVHDAKGQVSRIHYRLEKAWAYHPKGGESSPLVIGNPIHASYTLAFESQWDALAVLDRLDAHNPENEGIYSAFITRGATSNTNLSKLAIPRLIAFPQNDPPEKKSKATGRTPAEEWLYKIQSTKHPITEFLVSQTPEQHKDANDWMRGDNPTHYQVFKRCIEGAENPALRGVFETKDLMAVDTRDDPDSMIGFGRRFLGKGGSWLWVGPSGIGKSTLIISLLIHAAAGVPWFGITFRRPLRVVVIQAENDRGDLAEMVRGAINASDLKPDQRECTMSNIRWVHETEKTGQSFCERTESLIHSTGADLVCIDPLLSYIGDDISQQKVASQFLRNWLQPVLKRTGAICLLVHHTGKTPKDTGAYKGWNDSDFSYLGIGSSDLTNWARAIATFTPHGANTGVYKFLIAKRGNRAGLRDMASGEPTNAIFLKHSGQGQGWAQCEAPEIVERPRNGGRIPKLRDEDVVAAFKGTTSPLRKDKLIAQLQTIHGVSEKTARDTVSRMLLADVIKLQSTNPRDGGGPAYKYLSLP